MGKSPKEFQEYILPESELGNLPRITLTEYMESPAVAFLRYCVHAHYAISFVRKHISSQEEKDKNAEARKGRKPDIAIRKSRLAIISAAMLPAIMGHFETFQKSLFAGIFEITPYLKTFDIKKFDKTLSKDIGVEIRVERIAGYRGRDVFPGIIVAEHLGGWHTPKQVNRYFKILLNVEPFDTHQASQLEVLWQLRHSIVHTAGILTPPDAQKISILQKWVNHYLVFEEPFISEVARKMHCVTKKMVERVNKAFEGQMHEDTPTEIVQRAKKLFKVTSPISSWLKECS